MAIQKFGMPMVQTIGKPKKTMAILSNIGKLHIIGKQNRPLPFESDRVLFPAPTVHQIKALPFKH